MNSMFLRKVAQVLKKLYKYFFSFKFVGTNQNEKRKRWLGQYSQFFQKIVECLKTFGNFKSVI